MPYSKSGLSDIPYGVVFVSLWSKVTDLVVAGVNGLSPFGLSSDLTSGNAEVAFFAGSVDV